MVSCEVPQLQKARIKAMDIWTLQITNYNEESLLR